MLENKTAPPAAALAAADAKALCASLSLVGAGCGPRASLRRDSRHAPVRLKRVPAPCALEPLQRCGRFGQQRVQAQRRHAERRDARLEKAEEFRRLVSEGAAEPSNAIEAPHAPQAPRCRQPPPPRRRGAPPAAPRFPARASTKFYQRPDVDRSCQPGATHVRRARPRFPTYDQTRKNVAQAALISVHDSLNAASGRLTAKGQQSASKQQRPSFYRRRPSRSSRLPVPPKRHVNVGVTAAQRGRVTRLGAFAVALQAQRLRPCLDAVAAWHAFEGFGNGLVALAIGLDSEFTHPMQQHPYVLSKALRERRDKARLQRPSHTLSLSGARGAFRPRERAPRPRVRETRAV